MGSYDQRNQNVGNQVNIGQAQINLPPELWRQLSAISERDQKENLAVADLKTEVWEPETVLISAGEFIMGTEVGDGVSKFETPQFKLMLPSYRIGKYPVTNEEYGRFVRETNRPVCTELTWENGRQPSPEQFNLPVKGVSWYDAIAYCLWLGEQTERPYTLPSEAQWEKAARGTTGMTFPWGDEWNGGVFCNIDGRQIKAVDAYQEGASPFGCFDMVGNVREWTSTIWGRHRRREPDERTVYPWQGPWKPNEGPDELGVNRQIRRVTRGGTTLIAGTELRAARRSSELPYRRGLTILRIGFRIALNLEE